MHPTEARQIHLTIGSRFENIELAQVVVDDALQQAGAGEDFRHWIGLALREAIANAIKHGNRLDPDKRVDIEVEMGDEVVLQVADEGHGFDPAGIPDPLAPENRFRGDGRGIFYMKKFMDHVDYAFRPSGGTVVTLRKRFTPLAKGSQER